MLLDEVLYKIAQRWFTRTRLLQVGRLVLRAELHHVSKQVHRSLIEVSHGVPVQAAVQPGQQDQPNQ